MSKLVIFSALIAIAFGDNSKIRSRVHSLDGGRIVGGEKAKIEDFPYQVSLQYSGRAFCGGSIISRNTVLTAAQCTDELPFPLLYLSIRYGSAHKYHGGTTLDVVKILQHHQFNPSTTDYDICVIRLSNNVEFGRVAQIVGLISAEASEGGRTGVVSGWGATLEGQSPSDELLFVTVNEIDRDKCNASYDGGITERMICFAANGKDTCKGDAGGPLVVNGVQVGVASWGFGCAHDRYPGVYSNVGELRTFIDASL